MKLTSKEAMELLEQERKNATNDMWIEHCISVGNYAGIIAKALNEKKYNENYNSRIFTRYWKI